MASLETAEKPDVHAGIDQLMALLARGDFDTARSYVCLLAEQWPESDIVRHYAEVLAPPRVLQVGPGVNQRFAQERKWMREHGSKYPGHWLAVRGDELLAASRDREDFHHQLQGKGSRASMLIHWQPDLSVFK